MPTFWKPNWEETKQHFIDWWNHDGLLVYIWNIPPVDNLHETVEHPGEAPNAEYFYTHPAWRACWLADEDMDGTPPGRGTATGLERGVRRVPDDDRQSRRTRSGGPSGQSLNRSRQRPSGATGPGATGRPGGGELEVPGTEPA